MAHLIDKDALVAEIKNLKKTYKKCPTLNSYEDGLKDGRLIGYTDALYKINSLEVKEVDFAPKEEPQRMVSAKAKEAGYSKPASKDFTFKSIPRILEMVEPSERAASYCEELAKSLENEGYLTDAKIVRNFIKMMNGEKVSMATMDEEPVSEDLEEASKEWLRPQLDMSYINYGESKMMELTHFDGYAMLDAIEFGAKWKEEQVMKNAVDAEVTYGKSLAIPSLGYFLDKNEMDVGDKIKLILIKSD